MQKIILKSQLISGIVFVLLVSLAFPGPSLAADGDPKWSPFATGGDIYSSPAIGSDGTVYVGSLDGYFYAIKPDDGTLDWSYSTGSVRSSPAIGNDGTIYIGSYDNSLYAIKPDGSLNWRYPTEDDVHSSPAIGSDGTVYVGSLDGYLYAIKPDGSLHWRYPTGKTYSSPVIGSEGTIYVGSYDNNLYALNPDGSLHWKYPTSDHIMYSSPAIGCDGTIYIGSGDHNLYAIEPDGTFKWRYATGDNGFSSPAIGSDGTIYVGSQYHNLYAMNPDGSLKWRYATGSWVYSSPAIGSDGTVYVGSVDGKLYAINPDGSLKWSYTTGAVYTSSPAIGTDGTIYVGSRDQNLYAIEGSGTLANTPWPMFHHNLLHTGRGSDKPSNPPNKPTLSLPVNGDTNVSLTPTLVAGSFSDPDSGDTHLHTRWQISTETDFSAALHLTSSSHLTSLIVPQLALIEGVTYNWRVRFYDNHSTASEWSDIYSFTTLTTDNDKNGNGIPDSQEVDETVDLDGYGGPDKYQDDIKSLNTVVGEGQMGVRFDPEDTSIEQVESSDPATIGSYSRPSMPFGLFGFRMKANEPGDLAEATVYFSQPAPEGLEWYMYNSVDGWVNYSDHAEFSTDRGSVVLTLKDGGFGDADGIANGFIVDPGGFGVASWIKGSVRDASTGELITHAKVTVGDLSFNAELDGNYLGMILPGTYYVTVWATGYKSTTSSIEIREGETVTHDFELDRHLVTIEASQPVSCSAQDTQTVEVTDNSSPIKGACVEIPPGALHSDCTITIGIVSSPPAFPANVTLIGKVIEFGPEGITFLKPVSIKIPFQQADLDQAGITDPNELEVFAYNALASLWKAVSVHSVDEVAKFLVCKVDHFSLYAIGISDDLPPPPPSDGGGGGGCFISSLATSGCW